MAWPPPVLPVNRTNATPQLDTHAADHNALAQAINDIVPTVTALGTRVYKFGFYAGALTCDASGWVTMAAAWFGLTSVQGGLAVVHNAGSTALNNESLLATITQPGSGGAVLITRVSKIWYTTPNAASWGFLNAQGVNVFALAWGTP